MNFQLQRTGEYTWDVLEEISHAENVTEFRIVAQLIADKDAWYIARPVWQDVGHYYERIPRPYVTSKAAINAATTFNHARAS